MRQGFIFDLDGTLADTMPAHYRAWTLTAARYGLTFPEDRFYSLGGVPTAKIAAMLVAEAGKDLDPMLVATEKERAYADSLDDPSAIRPIPAVIQIAREYREAGAGPLAVASGSV